MSLRAKMNMGATARLGCPGGVSSGLDRPPFDLVGAHAVLGHAVPRQLDLRHPVASLRIVTDRWGRNHVGGASGEWQNREFPVANSHLSSDSQPICCQRICCVIRFIHGKQPYPIGW